MKKLTNYEELLLEHCERAYALMVAADELSQLCGGTQQEWHSKLLTHAVHQRSKLGDDAFIKELMSHLPVPLNETDELGEEREQFAMEKKMIEGTYPHNN